VQPVCWLSGLDSDVPTIRGNDRVQPVCWLSGLDSDVPTILGNDGVQPVCWLSGLDSDVPTICGNDRVQPVCWLSGLDSDVPSIRGTILGTIQRICYQLQRRKSRPLQSYARGVQIFLQTGNSHDPWERHKARKENLFAPSRFSIVRLPN
jgi:hypothetical protein